MKIKCIKNVLLFDNNYMFHVGQYHFDSDSKWKSIVRRSQVLLTLAILCVCVYALLKITVTFQDELSTKLDVSIVEKSQQNRVNWSTSFHKMIMRKIHMVDEKRIYIQAFATKHFTNCVHLLMRK